MKLFKKLLCILLSTMLVLLSSGCGGRAASDGGSTGGSDASGNGETVGTHLSMRSLPVVQTTGLEFAGLSDPKLHSSIEDAIYAQLVHDLDSGEYVVERVEAVYISQEYIDESSYNSKANIYFGSTLEELEAQYQGERYVFTLGEDGQTTTHALSEDDDGGVLLPILKNVAWGTGVILLRIVVDVVVTGVETQSVTAIIGVAVGDVADAFLSTNPASVLFEALLAGLEAGDVNQALQDAALSLSEGYLLNAMGGLASNGLIAATGLDELIAHGLTPDEVATIQQESQLPAEVIGQLESMEQYEALKEADLFPRMVNGRTALVRDIDLNLTDDEGRTNLDRMASGLAPLDSSGAEYELRRFGPNDDSTIAILTSEELQSAGNGNLWSQLAERTVGDDQSQAFWEAINSGLMASA